MVLGIRLLRSFMGLTKKNSPAEFETDEFCRLNGFYKLYFSSQGLLGNLLVLGGPAVAVDDAAHDIGQNHRSNQVDDGVLL